MALKGKISLLMCHIEPTFYRKYIVFDKRGKPVLYVKNVEVPIWTATKGTPILPKNGQGFSEIWT